jgi:hypothetical protein
VLHARLQVCADVPDGSAVHGHMQQLKVTREVHLNEGRQQAPVEAGDATLSVQLLQSSNHGATVPGAEPRL